MTDPDDLDDLASAHLDGATTPAEAARVASDPELLARVAALREVRMSLQAEATSAADPERREQAVAAALAAWDDDALAPVHSLAEVAARRRGPSRRGWRVVGVAAAVAALIALVPILASRSSDDDQTASEDAALSDRAGGADAVDESTTAGDALTPEASSGAESPAATTTTAGSPTGTGGLDEPVVALGAYDTVADLVAAATAAVGQDPTAYSFADDADRGVPCADALLAALPADATVELVGAATVDGRAVSVVVTATDVRTAGDPDCAVTTTGR